MGYNSSDGFLQEFGTKTDDLPVGKQIEEKGADVLKPFGTTQV